MMTHQRRPLRSLRMGLQYPALFVLYPPVTSADLCFSSPPPRLQSATPARHSSATLPLHSVSTPQLSRLPQSAFISTGASNCRGTSHGHVDWVWSPNELSSSDMFSVYMNRSLTTPSALLLLNLSSGSGIWKLRKF